MGPTEGTRSVQVIIEDRGFHIISVVDLERTGLICLYYTAAPGSSPMSAISV